MINNSNVDVMIKNVYKQDGSLRKQYNNQVIIKHH